VRIAYVVGARPNLVKTAPVIAALARRLPAARHILINTGQHYDRQMFGLLMEELGVPEPDHTLRVGSGTHAQQTARAMERIEPVLEAERPDLVIVPGDVNSTLAATLVATKLGLRVGHLEAGLRSFDRTMPEEINRIVADALADDLFLHCEEAIENLRREGVADRRMHFVGNTMIDSLVAMLPRARSIATAERFGLRGGDYVLVTLHRPALVDGPRLLEVMRQLEELARTVPVLFPVHPRTRRALPQLPTPAGLLLTEPLGYLEFLSLEACAAAVLTDSGGVQEETTYLGVRCFTLRNNTERPVTVRAGTNRLLGLNPAGIRQIRPLLDRLPPQAPEPPPLWDGHAAERVADVVENELLVGDLQAA
jgi:UDP-N-acetylglucosamine 2-epimerase (non-hydrolysing)